MNLSFSNFRFHLIAALMALAIVVSMPSYVLAADKLLVRLDFSPWGMHGAMHLAAEKGWYKDADLDVEIQDGTGTINTLQLLGSGRVDIGQVSVGTMAVAKESGLDLISVAGFSRTGDLAVLVDKNSDINTPQDLVGKKIVCFTTSPWAPFIEPYLAANKLTKNDVEVVMVSPSAMVSTYASENSDGFMSQAPFGEPMVAKTRPAKSLLLGDSGISFPSYGLVTTTENLDSKRDALKRFVQVQLKAWDYIYDGHIEEAVQAILAQRPNAKLDADVLRGQLESYRDFFNSPTHGEQPIGKQFDEDWVAAIDSMIKTNQIKPGRKPSDYYTNELLD